MVVVLPEPLTPITRITCGRGKPQTSSGLATGARIFSISSARIERRPRSSSRSNFWRAMASRMRCEASGPRSDAISASSMSSSVDGVERGAAGQAGEVVGDLLRSLREPAAQAVEPTHAHTAVRWSPSRPVMRALPVSPRGRSGDGDRARSCRCDPCRCSRSARAASNPSGRPASATGAPTPRRGGEPREPSRPRGRAAACAPPACWARREGEDVSRDDVAIIEQFQRVQCHVLGFGGKAGDQVGADRRIGPGLS